MGDGKPKPTEKLLSEEYLTIEFLPVGKGILKAPEFTQGFSSHRGKVCCCVMASPAHQFPSDKAFLNQRQGGGGQDQTTSSVTPSTAILQALFLHFPDGSHHSSSLLIPSQRSCWEFWAVSISALDQTPSANETPRGFSYTSWEMSLSLRHCFSYVKITPLVLV